MFNEDSKAKSALYAGILLTFLGYTGRYFGIEPLHNQFFAFAAWAYVLFIDNAVYRLTGRSLLVSRTEEFFMLALWSMGISALFELLNLRLGAWYYMNQPSTLSTRWTGWLFTWASVLPSIFVTAEMLAAFGLFRGFKARRLAVRPGLIQAFFVGGVVLLALALAAPGYFRLLAWPALFLLAEPLAYRLGLGSLVRELEGGLPGKTLRLGLAGLLCGALWAAWNTGTTAKLVYTFRFEGLPLVSGLPVAAYAGFAFSALVMYSLYSLASALRAGKTWEDNSWPMPGKQPGLREQALAAGLALLTLYSALHLVDAHTVGVFVGSL